MAVRITNISRSLSSVGGKFIVATKNDMGPRTGAPILDEILVANWGIDGFLPSGISVVGYLFQHEYQQKQMMLVELVFLDSDHSKKINFGTQATYLVEDFILGADDRELKELLKRKLVDLD